jgi:hypothetical protein
VASAWSEHDRLAFLLGRDGHEATQEWARRTMQIYRRAVLAHGHFARLPKYRRRFIESYCELKRWVTGASARMR